MFSELLIESVQSFFLIQCALPKTRKPNVFRIPFRDKSTIKVMTLFEHVWQTLCLYLSMCLRLKWVGYDKLLGLKMVQKLYIWVMKTVRIWMINFNYTKTFYGRFINKNCQLSRIRCEFELVFYYKSMNFISRYIKKVWRSNITWNYVRWTLW